MMILRVVIVLTTCLLLASAEYPPRPYMSVWNAPTKHCFNGSLDLSKYAIMQNENDAINGGNITLFSSVGQFPVLESQGNSTVNGGIPQLGNLSLHLEMVQKDIQSLIPDPNFKGLAVMDFHSWKPLYQQNFGDLEIYKTQSRAYTQKKHPNLNGTDLEAQAKKDFDTAARTFLEGTLELAKKLRPGGLWGYLGYPYCYAVLGYYCDNMGVQENDEIQWLFNASTALYPSVFYPQQHDLPDAVIDLVSVIHESHRVMAKVATPLYVYAYTRYSYIDQPKVFYTKDDVEESTFFASAFGVDGVVVYGTIAHTASNSLCDGLMKFINSTYGPTNKSAYDWALQCSQDQCNSNGQCVDISEGRKVHLRKVGSPLLYKCRCYHGWQGDDCKTPA